MKILLDTTYFLPIIGVNIKGLSNDLLIKLLKNKDYELCYCDVTLFELAAKGAKLVLAEHSLTIDDITKGLDSLIYDKRFTNISWLTYPFILELASEVRKVHSDFLDCLILSTAVYQTDIFAMFDETLFKKISRNKTLLSKILE